MKKVNILVDMSHIKAMPSSAISVHIYGGRLIKGFEEGAFFHPIVLVARGMENYIDSLAGFEVDKIVISNKEKVTFSVKLDRILGLIPFEKQLQYKKISVVLSPEFAPFTYSFPKKYKQHLIIHDLIRIHLPQGKGDFYYNYMFKLKVAKVPYIISISSNTKRSLKEWTGRDSVAIHNSIPFDFQVDEIPINDLQDKRYVLDLNRFDRYKNQEVLIMAFNKLKNRIPHILYLKGYSDNTYINELRSLVSQLGLENRVIMDTCNRTEGEICWLYRHADLFVTSSIEEGFGYTPIEAAVLKTPVLISDIPTLKEVTQGKIETFNPHSPEELAEKMNKVIFNPPSDEERTALSEFYLKEYSLEKQMEQITNVILHNIGYSDE